MTDEVNQWITKNVTPVFLQNGVRKVAYVLPKDILARTGVELFVEKLFTEAKEIHRMVFDDPEKAIEWLLRS